MGKIYCVMGKSSSGKDSIYSRIMQQGNPALLRIVPYTTRPRREGETDGREYVFTDEAHVQQLESAGKVIELRAYHTVYGIWKYFTVDDGRNVPEISCGCSRFFRGKTDRGRHHTTVYK